MGVALLSILIPPDNPGWRIVILVVGGLLIADAVRKTDWVKERNPVLSLTHGFIPNESDSFWREVLASVFVAAAITGYGFITWPAKLEQMPSRQTESVLVPVPMSGGSGGTHLGGPSTPNGILPPNVIPVTPAKPPAPKPKAVTPKKSESEPPPIQIAPSFGNIRERAILLSRQIMEDLYRHGWPPPGGQQLPLGFVIEKMPTTPKEAVLWDHFRSDTFRFDSLQKLIAIRDEFAELHYHDNDLDQLVESEKRNKEEYGQDFTKWPALFLQENQRVCEELVMLANQIPVK
jgi:hypothetical protein